MEVHLPSAASVNTLCIKLGLLMGRAENRLCTRGEPARCDPVKPAFKVRQLKWHFECKALCVYHDQARNIH